jgi:hypothetical protein
MATTLALPDVAPMLDADLTATAARAAVTPRPSRLEQIGATGGLVREAPLKLHDRSREAGPSHAADRRSSAGRT